MFKTYKSSFQEGLRLYWSQNVVQRNINKETCTVTVVFPLFYPTPVYTYAHISVFSHGTANQFYPKMFLCHDKAIKPNHNFSYSETLGFPKEKKMTHSRHGEEKWIQNFSRKSIGKWTLGSRHRHRWNDNCKVLVTRIWIGLGMN
jgi:hypothetical protein